MLSAESLSSVPPYIGYFSPILGTFSKRGCFLIQYLEFVAEHCHCYCIQTSVFSILIILATVLVAKGANLAENGIFGFMFSVF